MGDKAVGKLMNITYDTEKKSLYVSIEIIDENFKEQILRDKDLKEKIIFKGADVMWVSRK